jgi:hypothetical protein
LGGGAWCRILYVTPPAICMAALHAPGVQKMVELLLTNSSYILCTRLTKGKQPFYVVDPRIYMLFW